MSAYPPQLAPFLQAVSDAETVWALQHEDDWVVCDSAEFENTDVMPIWSSKEAASAFCIDAWAEYQPAPIPLDDFLEYWVGDLNEDGVLVGIEWPLGEDASPLELDPIVLIKALVGDRSGP